MNATYTAYPIAAVPTSITDASTPTEVQLWLDANGYSASMAALDGVTGAQLLTMTRSQLLEAAPAQGAAIYNTLHGDASLLAHAVGLFLGSIQTAFSAQ